MPGRTDRQVAFEKLLCKRLSAKDGGVLPGAAIGSLTLKEATDDLIADYKTNKRKSLRDVQGKITMHLLPLSGERRKMTSIGTPEIRRFIAHRLSEERDDDGKITKRAAKPADINVLPLEWRHVDWHGRCVSRTRTRRRMT